LAKFANIIAPMESRMRPRGLAFAARSLARLACAAAIAGPAGASAPTNAAAAAASAYTQFDAKTCRHRKGRAVEDYGSWLRRGYAKIAVRLSAGDQRMHVSFGPRAASEPAAAETLPAFNDAYQGTIEWRLGAFSGKRPALGLDPRVASGLPSENATNQSKAGRDGKMKPFATILRWNVMQEGDHEKPSGRVLVVTRIAPGGVCHIGYVDARANPDANALARQLADERAREFRCGIDSAEWAGKRG
jgi:hypothetical protein